MKKIILSLMFVLIALMGIASVSACDVDNCTCDMCNCSDDYYDTCHYHENNLENIGAVGIGKISIDDDVGLENVSAADNQKDLENVSYVDDNNATNWYINGRFSSVDNISFANLLFKNPCKYHLESEFIINGYENGIKVRVVDDSGKGISHCALRAGYIYRDSDVTTVCWNDCNYKTYYTDKDGYFTYLKPAKEGKRVWIEIHIKGYSNDDARTWLCC